MPANIFPTVTAVVIAGRIVPEDTAGTEPAARGETPAGIKVLIVPVVPRHTPAVSIHMIQESDLLEMLISDHVCRTKSLRRITTGALQLFFLYERGKPQGALRGGARPRAQAVSRIRGSA